MLLDIIYFSIIFKIILFIYLGCAESLLLELFSSFGEQGLSLVAMHRVPTAVVSLVVEHRFLSAQAPERTGS